MERAFRVVKRTFLIAGLLLLLAVPVSAAVSTAVHYQGTCSDTSGTGWACSRWEYAAAEMFWALFIFIPFLFLATLVYLGMSLAQFIAAKPWKRRSRRQDA